jgi:hypothetical protein
MYSAFFVTFFKYVYIFILVHTDDTVHAFKELWTTPRNPPPSWLCIYLYFLKRAGGMVGEGEGAGREVPWLKEDKDRWATVISYLISWFISGSALITGRLEQLCT